MAEFCEFQQPGTGATICVNPNQVRAVKQLENGSRIEFENDHFVSVTDNPAEAAKKLSAALG